MVDQHRSPNHRDEGSRHEPRSAFVPPGAFDLVASSLGGDRSGLRYRHAPPCELAALETPAAQAAPDWPGRLNSPGMPALAD